MSSELRLHGYQETARDYIAARPCAALFLDM